MSDIIEIVSNEYLDPEAVVAIRAAYDLACRTLQNIGELEADREIIVREILHAAETGDRDVNKLCERAIKGLCATDFRQQ